MRHIHFGLNILYKYRGEVLAQGKEGTKNELAKDEKRLCEIEKAIWAEIKKQNS